MSGSSFTCEDRETFVGKFRFQWQTERISISSFSDSIKVSPGTLRNWIERFDPDLLFAMKRAGRKKLRDNDQNDGGASGSPAQEIAQNALKPVQVKHEEYPDEEQHALPLHEVGPANLPATIHDHPAVLELRDRINRLEKENRFLKQSVAFWVRQDQEALL